MNILVYIGYVVGLWPLPAARMTSWKGRKPPPGPPAELHVTDWGHIRAMELECLGEYYHRMDGTTMGLGWQPVVDEAPQEHPATPWDDLTPADIAAMSMREWAELSRHMYPLGYRTWPRRAASDSSLTKTAYLHQTIRLPNGSVYGPGFWTLPQGVYESLARLGHVTGGPWTIGGPVGLSDVKD